VKSATKHRSIVSQSHHAQPKLEISADSLTVEVDSTHGGTIRRFTLREAGRQIELLRPSPAHSHDPLDSGCFPLVPFSNRICRGAFEWDGRQIRLPLNMAGDSNAIHGHGWQREWQIVDRDKKRIVLAYDHGPDAWPFAYRAEQTFDLSSEGLIVGLSLTNRSTEPMPAGLGFHPYFPKPQTGGLRTDLSGVWLNGPDMLPTGHLTQAVPRELLSGWTPPGATSLDHCFTGWSGQAEIDIGDTNRMLRLTASGNLEFLVVFAPEGADFFCAEPVTNINNAVNWRDRADTGLVTLEPAAEMRASMSLRLSK
jgi:aldose 1-epimerase